MSAQPRGAEAPSSVRVLEIFRAHTQYELHDLRLEADLEADLGIDSVTLTSILVDVGKHFGVPHADLRARGFTTIGQLLEHLGESAEPQPGIPEIRGAVLAIAAERTGYATADLSTRADLEAELGIDSVTFASILAGVSRAFGLDEHILQTESFRSLDALVEFLGRLGARPVPAAPPAPRDEGPADEPIEDRAGAPAGAEALLEELGRGLRPDEPFVRQGLSERDRERILERVERELGISRRLRLEDCDTLEKLEAFVRAAAPSRVQRLGEGPPPARRATPPIADRRTLQDFQEGPDPDLFAKTRAFARFMADRRRENAYWFGMAVEGRPTNRAVIYDELAGRPREFLLFASNNYLGLAGHPRVVAAIRDAASRYGATNTGSRIIGGTHRVHKELERRLAGFKGTEAAIVFPSGYSANLGTIGALVRAGDAAIGDKHNHMSIVDGCRISGGRMRIYRHNDMADLERVLEKESAEPRGKLIVTDGVFSMHGDVCDLPEIVRLAKAYGARVLVDDAHATGVLGRTGAGTSEHFGLKGQVDLELGTFSKTLAGVGGFVCGPESVIDYLRFYAHSYVFAATIPAPVAAGLVASLEVLQAEPERVRALWRNIDRFKARLVELGFVLGDSASAIVPLLVGDYAKTLELGRAVRDRGLFCQTVVYPGVAAGEERLRLSVSSEHTPEDLELAATILAEAADEVGLPRRGREGE